MMLGSGFEIADGAPRFLRHAKTAALAPHGFFSAEGGISTGIYASLNCGYGSADDPALVSQNRSAAAVATPRLTTKPSTTGLSSSMILS